MCGHIDFFIVENDPGVPAGRVGDPFAGLDGATVAALCEVVGGAALAEAKDIGTAQLAANVGARDAALRQRYGRTVSGATEQRNILRLASKNAMRALKPRIKESSKMLWNLMEQWLRGDIKRGEMRTQSSAVLRKAYEEARQIGRRASGLARMKSAGVPERVQREEEEWFRGAVREELRYWHRFLDEIHRGQVTEKRRGERFDAYIRSIRFMYEAARVQALPDTTLLHWMGPKKDDPNICAGCVLMMEWSPFTKATIPAVPRDGSTPCLSNCRHRVVVRVARSYNDVIRRNNQLDRLKIETRRAAGSANPRARMVKKLQEVKEEAHGGRRRGKRLKGRAGNPFVGEKLPTVPRYGGRVGMLRMQEARVRPPRPHSVELPGDIPVAWAVGGRVHEMSAATRRYTKGRVVVWAPIEEVFEATERWQWINLNDPLPARVWQAKWYWSTGRAMDPPQIGIAEASGQVLFDDGRHRLAAAWQLGERAAPMLVPAEDVDRVRAIVPGARLHEAVDDESKETAGIFLRLPRDIADKFPPLGEEDKSPPHCTLLFVGEVDAKGYEDIVDVASTVCRRLQPFVIEMTDYGEFTNPKGQTIAHMIPRVVGTGPNLADIHEMLYQEAVGRGMRVDHIRSGAFKPHVTLAYMPAGKRYTGPRPTASFRVDSFDVWGSGVWFEGELGNTRVPLGGGLPVVVDEGLDEAGSIGTPHFNFDAVPYATMDLRDIGRLLVNAAKKRDGEALVGILDRLLSALEHTVVAVEGRPRGTQVARMFRRAFVELVAALKELPESVSGAVRERVDRLDDCLILMEQAELGIR